MSDIIGRHDEPVGSSLRLELEITPQAPSLARAAVTSFASRRQVESNILATLQLLISELVTNAVIHPHAPIGSKIALTASLAAGTIRVEVLDQGNGFVPTPRDPARITGGYGLFLLEQQAARWGIDRRGGNSVWFELAT